jgi:hypothetical protein
MNPDQQPPPLTPAQAVHYSKLRNVIFTVGVTVFAFLMWRAMGAGELERPHLTGTARALALTLSTAVALGAAWLMSCGAAKMLARSIKP